MFHSETLRDVENPLLRKKLFESKNKLRTLNRYILEYETNLVLVWGGQQSFNRLNAATILWNAADEEMISGKAAARSGHLHCTPSILKPGFFFSAVASPPSR